jgi:hypothetical protein
MVCAESGRPINIAINAVNKDFEIDMCASWVSMIRHLFGGKRLPDG